VADCSGNDSQNAGRGGAEESSSGERRRIHHSSSPLSTLLSISFLRRYAAFAAGCCDADLSSSFFDASSGGIDTRGGRIGGQSTSPASDVGSPPWYSLYVINLWSTCADL